MTIKRNTITGAIIGVTIACVVMVATVAYVSHSQRTRFDAGEGDRMLWTLLLVVFGPGGALGAKLHSLLTALGYAGTMAGIQKVTAVVFNIILGTVIGWSVGRRLHKRHKTQQNDGQLSSESALSDEVSS